MEIAGFESGQYFAFVVSDLNQAELLQLARGVGSGFKRDSAHDSTSAAAKRKHEMGEPWLDVRVFEAWIHGANE